MQKNDPRSSPVIVITGTPGTGKTTHAQLLVEQSPVPLRHINVSELVKEKMLHDGFDEEWQTYLVDEDKVRLCIGIVPTSAAHVRSIRKFQVVDELEPLVDAGGGLILDWHTCDAFPERWIDLVVVLQCNHTQLWDRLEARCVLIFLRLDL